MSIEVKIDRNEFADMATPNPPRAKPEWERVNLRKFAETLKYEHCKCTNAFVPHCDFCNFLQGVRNVQLELQSLRSSHAALVEEKAQLRETLNRSISDMGIIGGVLADLDNHIFHASLFHEDSKDPMMQDIIEARKIIGHYLPSFDDIRGVVNKSSEEVAMIDADIINRLIDRAIKTEQAALAKHKGDSSGNTSI